MGQVGSHVLRSRWKQRLGGGPGLCLGGRALSLPWSRRGWGGGPQAAMRQTGGFSLCASQPPEEVNRIQFQCKCQTHPVMKN